MASLFAFSLALLALGVQTMAQEEPQQDEPLRIIVFGAHPDDCELKVGGTAARWAKQGHKVKFVSMTNGDIGHHEMAGGPLAQRRTAEVQKCAEILGIETEVLDIHDGELMPTLENRRTVTRLIREWEADLVLSHRPNDYHPDHRYTGILVQDAAFMVIVPYFCPDVPALRVGQLREHRQREDARLVVEGVGEVLWPVPEVLVRLQERQGDGVVDAGLHPALVEMAGEAVAVVVPDHVEVIDVLPARRGRGRRQARDVRQYHGRVLVDVCHAEIWLKRSEWIRRDLRLGIRQHRQ